MIQFFGKNLTNKTSFFDEKIRHFFNDQIYFQQIPVNYIALL